MAEGPLLFEPGDYLVTFRTAPDAAAAALCEHLDGGRTRADGTPLRRASEPGNRLHVYLSDVHALAWLRARPEVLEVRVRTAEERLHPSLRAPRGEELVEVYAQLLPGRGSADFEGLIRRLGAEFLGTTTLRGPEDEDLSFLQLELPGSRLPALADLDGLRLVVPAEPERLRRPQGQAPPLPGNGIRLALPAADGFRSPNERPRVLPLEVRSSLQPLEVRLRWSDEPTLEGDEGPERRSLSLRLVDPAGQDHAVAPRASLSGAGRRGREFHQPAPLPGTWYAVIDPGDGSYVVPLTFEIEAAGDLGGTSVPMLLDPQTASFEVLDGWDSDRARTLQTDGTVAVVNASDNDLLRVRGQSFISFQFAPDLAAGTTAVGLRLRLEHHEATGLQPGEFEVQLAQGSPAAPTRLQTLALATRSGPGAEGEDVLEAALPADLSAGLLAVVRNSSNGADTLVDRVLLEVDFVVDAPPTITSTPSTEAMVGEPYHYDADDTAEAEGAAPLTWSAPLAPAEFALDARSGRISWTPTVAGGASVQLRATNGLGFQQQSFTVQVAPAAGGGSGPPVITSTPFRFGFAKEFYHYDEDDRLEAEGGGPITWSLLEGPRSMIVDPTSGLMTFFTPGVGSGTITVQAANAFGTATQSFFLTVIERPPTPTFSSTPNLSGTVGQPYHYDADDRAEAAGPGGRQWSLPLAPAGMSLALDGTVSWTPTTPGSFPVTLQVSNLGGAVEQSFVIVVDPAPSGTGPTFTSEPAGEAVLAQPWAYDADGRVSALGNGPVTYSLVSGPLGFQVDAITGAVTWTPTATGLVRVTVRAADVDGATLQSFEVHVPLESVVVAANDLPIVYLPPERLAEGGVRTTQVLNVFLPAGTPPPGGFPVMLMNGAGGGDSYIPPRRLNPAGSLDLLHGLVESGIAVVLYGTTGFNAQRILFYPPGHASGRYESYLPSADMPEKETEWAIQWAKFQTTYPLNPERMGVGGSSMGAILAVWGAMGPEHGRASGSTQVTTSTRVKGVLAFHPPVSAWAYDQSPDLVASAPRHFEQAARPGVPADSFGEVDEVLQKDVSIMRFAFRDAAARANNAAQSICMIYAEPFNTPDGSSHSLAVDAEGFPLLHDVLGQPSIHDSWHGYMFFDQLLKLPGGQAFHPTNSVLAVEASVAAKAAVPLHTRTFQGAFNGPEAHRIALRWVLDTL